jgi:hypothetical protein
VTVVAGNISIDDVALTALPATSPPPTGGWAGLSLPIGDWLWVGAAVVILVVGIAAVILRRGRIPPPRTGPPAGVSEGAPPGPSAGETSTSGPPPRRPV